MEDSNGGRPGRRVRMNLFWETIVSDLRHFARELLDPGLAPVRSGESSTGQQTNTGLDQIWLKAAEGVIRRLDHLLADLEQVEEEATFSTRFRPHPHGGFFPRTATSYAHHNGRLVPKRWEHPVSREIPDPEVLRWLLHVIDLLHTRISEREQQLSEWITDADKFRSFSTDVWSLNEQAHLKEMLSPYHRGAKQLLRARSRVCRIFNYRPTPRRVRPEPYPQSPAWFWISRLHNLLQHPQASLPHFVQALLAEPVSLADRPFLFQRWCGLKILEACRKEKWKITGDSLGCLFLGGQLQLRKEETEVTLWIEARLPTDHGHPANLRSKHTTPLSPDYIFQITQGNMGTEAFSLDATLMHHDDAARLKADKYLNGLIGTDWNLVCGVPAERGLARSWLAVPIDSPTAKLLDRHGQTGLIPFHPLHWNDMPIRHWMRDVEQS